MLVTQYTERTFFPPVWTFLAHTAICPWVSEDGEKRDQTIREVVAQVVKNN